MVLDIEVDCENLENLISEAEIVGINRRITEPETSQPDSLGFDNPEFDAGRDEDYHYLRNPAILETLVQTKLPYECRENSNLLRLTSVVMEHIASNQAFSEGNKRTVYITGILFLVRVQLQNRDTAHYPLLDKELTNKLQELAVEKIGRKECHSYLDEQLG